MQTESITNRVTLAMLATQRASWEQGVAAQALLEMGQIDLAILLARDAALRQGQDGRLGSLGSENAVTDPAANGVPVLYAARFTDDRTLKQAAQRMLDYLMNEAPRTKDGVLHHITNARQVWADSFYMAPPFLAVAGQPQEAVRQVEGLRRLLWNEEKKLYAHIWDEDKNALARSDCWGVGNGWAAAGIARVIRSLPADMADEKARLAQYCRAGIDGCLTHQRADGLFHNVVDDPTTFVETNLAQMLAYTIYRGAAAGWLPRTYLEAADRMRAAAHQKVDESGLVQGVCGSPEFEYSGTATEGQAFFLLMEAARHDLT
jgi:unsaturated rhamnogalacturonyl hydrolase